MIGLISAFDENEKQANKAQISFVHFDSKDKEDIKIELAPLAQKFANTFDLKKVYLFYGKDEKIVYEYEN